MSITIGSNIGSLTAQRKLAQNSASLGRVFERLSSGQRINRASDDAAGLSIADSLNAQSRIFNQGVRNLNDGLSLLDIADSAIENLSSIMIRLEELAAQAANGVYTNKQRKAMDDEAQALSKEFFRISKTTAFNGQRLLNGEFSEVSLQAGVGHSAVVSAGVGGAMGTGSFGTTTEYLQPETAGSIAVTSGDLNGDGIVDLVSAGFTDTGDGIACVRIGTGNGAFGTAVAYAMESAYTPAVKLGDLNGDGILDMVTAGRSDAADGYATVRLGRGDGTFAEATSYATESRESYGVQLTDLNRDGILDLLTAGRSDATDGYATVRLGRGDGTFDAARSYTTESARSYGLAVGDLNGDGIIDLVTAGHTDTNDGFATVRLGQGDGTFGAAVSYSSETWRSFAVSVGDLNGDGVLDLVTAGCSDAFDGYATVRLGRGDGTFGQATSYSTEPCISYALTLGDLNGDGMLDLISAGYTDAPYDGKVTVRLGGGDGTFGQATSYSSETGFSTGVALGDFNGDGVFDLVTAGYSDADDGYLNVRLGNTRDGIQPLLPFSLTTMADARQALPVFQRKREQLAEQRGEIGAFQSRVDVARNVLEVSSENFRAAESRIRDADIAAESSQLVRLSILQQAASSVLAQANQQPALALQLLSA